MEEIKYKTNIIKIRTLQCKISTHYNSAIIGGCVDSSCHEDNKFVCVECVFDTHSGHKLTKSERLSDHVNAAIKQSLEKDNESLMIKDKIDNETNCITNEIEKIKTNILEIFNIKLNKFINSFKELVSNGREGNDNENKELFDYGNSPQYPPSNEVEMTKLSSLLFKYYNNNIEDKESTKNKEIAGTAIDEINNFNYKFLKMIKQENINIVKIFNEEFLKEITTASLFRADILNSFEWADITYGDYDFLYKFSDNNKKATKDKENSTITMIRSKDKLDTSSNYSIVFETNYQSIGDYDFGFGTEAIGPACWLRGETAFAITTSGLIVNGVGSNVNIKSTNGINKYEFLIYFKPITPTCLIKLNNIEGVEFEIPRQEDDIFVLAAIRRIGDSITVKDYKLID